jgi:hypothetical protein
MDNSEKNGNIGCTRRRQTKQKHNTICVGHHYARANTHMQTRQQPSYNVKIVSLLSVSIMIWKRLLFD